MIDIERLRELFEIPIPDDQNVDSAHSPSWNQGYRTAVNEIRPQVLALIMQLEATERDSGEAAQVEQDSERFEWLERQVRKSRTGISFDWIPGVDGDPSGYRFMRFHFIGEQAKTIRQAIDKAREPSQ